MASYYLTNKAVEDLANIWNYTFDEWSERQADNYYQTLIDRCEYIANNPDLGKSYDKVDSSLLGLKANKHIIFYRIIGDLEVEIIRILHERMDLRNRMKE